MDKMLSGYCTKKEIEWSRFRLLTTLPTDIIQIIAILPVCDTVRVS